MKENVIRLLCYLGANPSYEGRKYLIDALTYLQGKEPSDVKVTTELYPMIAQKYGIRKGSVDKSIFYLKESLWNTPRSRKILEDVCGLYGYPGNKDFIGALVIQLQLMDQMGADSYFKYVENRLCFYRKDT